MAQKVQTNTKTTTKELLKELDASKYEHPSLREIYAAVKRKKLLI